jgi:L-2-hydroxyglutarate oxidase
VATSERELPALAELERRGLANGLTGIRRLTPAEMRQIEPHVAGIAGLHVPETGIVNYQQVAEAYARVIRGAGGAIQLSWRFTGARVEAGGLVVETTSGTVRARLLINCAGLQSDRVAWLCGVDPGVQIVPFRGEYYELKPAAAHLCRHLIYPVPDPRLPFLGVHLTRMIGGGVECGPNAVLAFKREGYSWRNVSAQDVREMATYAGFWRMAARFWRTGCAEIHRSLSRRAFWRSLRRLVPDLRMEYLARAGAGVRAQAVSPDGKLVDDFFIRQSERMIHVLNAPSPAATASIAIGRTIAEMALRHLG